MTRELEMDLRSWLEVVDVIVELTSGSYQLVAGGRRGGPVADESLAHTGGVQIGSSRHSRRQRTLGREIGGSVEVETVLQQRIRLIQRSQGHPDQRRTRVLSQAMVIDVMMMEGSTRAAYT